MGADLVSREELHEMVWSMPMIKVAEQFKVSGSYMARVCSARVQFTELMRVEKRDGFPVGSVRDFAEHLLNNKLQMRGCWCN
jgi:hypothetical protein